MLVTAGLLWIPTVSPSMAAQALLGYAAQGILQRHQHAQKPQLNASHHYLFVEVVI